MAITLPYPTLSDPASKTELEQNFQAVAGAFGSITTSDLSAQAGITNDQLARRRSEFHLNYLVRTAEVAAGWPGAGTVVAAQPIPEGAATDAYTLTRVAWVCTDCGAGTGVFRLELGSYVAGVWTPTTVLATMTISNGGVANSAQQGLSGVLTQTISATATPASIALVGDTAEAGTLTTALAFLSVSLKIIRIHQV